MPEPQHIVALIITGLGAVAFFMIKSWANTWETRLTAVDDRLDSHEKRLGKHDVNHATLETNLENITKITQETRNDVKDLLRNSNGNRATG